MYRQDALYRFDFYDNQVGNKKIQPQDILKSSALVRNRNFDLSRNPNISGLKLHRKRLFINGLEQPRTENPMNLDRRADDFTRQVVFSLSAPSAFSAPLRWVEVLETP